MTIMAPWKARKHLSADALLRCVRDRFEHIPDARAPKASIALPDALMAGFAGFVALCAQIAIRTPWTTVPITGQTFAVLVTGGALGAWRQPPTCLVT